MKREFEEIFSVLMHGSPLEAKEAKRRIEKLWHGHTKKFQKHAHIVLNYLPRFETIPQQGNQAAFVSGLRFFFLALADEHFDALKNFTLMVMQHPNGHVRESMRKTADWLYVSLTSRLMPLTFSQDAKLTSEQQQERERAREQYRAYVHDIEELILVYQGNDDASVHSLDELTPSISKSLQLLWHDVTRSNVYWDAVRSPPETILTERKHIEDELSEMFKRGRCALGVDAMKERIYHEHDIADLQRLVSFLDPDENLSNFQRQIDTIRDAWNYFPHEVLRGLSPAEIAQEGDMQQKQVVHTVS
jgi:hypothetical protein